MLVHAETLILRKIPISTDISKWKTQNRWGSKEKKWNIKRKLSKK